MSEKNDPYGEIIRSFYSNGFHRINKIKGEVTTFLLNGCIEEQQQEIDQFNVLFLEQAKSAGSPAECKQGCDYCCHQEVFALDIEMNRIIEHINSTYSVEDKAELLSKAQTKLSKTKNKEQKEWEKERTPCPLLKDGGCRVYALRPMGCRIYLSHSHESCISHCRSPKENQFPALFELPLRCGQMMNEGFVQALRKQDIGVKEASIEQALVDGIV